MSKQMCAVISVVDHSKGDAIAEIYRQEQVPVCFSIHGYGAADSAILDILGFGENKKDVTLSLMPPEQVQQVFAVADQKLHISKPGTGILISLPVTGATAFLAGLINPDWKLQTQEKEGGVPMVNEHDHELILTIVSKGYFPEVKAAANAAGARGGTLIHALGLGGEEAQKFLGISIQPEKDIILIVVKREEKQKIMQAIAQAAGINTKGQGIIFSLPVDAAIGLCEIPYGMDEAE